MYTNSVRFATFSTTKISEKYHKRVSQTVTLHSHAIIFTDSKSVLQTVKCEDGAQIGKSKNSTQKIDRTV